MIKLYIKFEAYMGNWNTAPDSLLVEFLTSAGSAIYNKDFNQTFINDLALDPSKTFRVAISKKQSKTGNAYYDYWQNAIPFPDGLETNLRVQGALIDMGKMRPSVNGHPTREGKITIKIEEDTYEVTVYLTEGKHPYYVKIIAHKMSSIRLGKPTLKPSGGSFV
jgi:hypothetical protein